ncbi:MAG: exonuclease SbcCD subunit D [Saccharofermentans sp.]|nr:exonuclease SbcCD subunit D [Saccharofermentans sp.]
MKILHTSDWHIGLTEPHCDIASDQRFFIDEICRIAAEQKVECILIAGDIYDRMVASLDSVKLHDYAANKICNELGITLCEIAGNHDGSVRLASNSQLLTKAGYFVAGSLSDGIGSTVIGNTEIFLLPWINESTVKSAYPDEADKIDDLTSAYEIVCSHIKEGFTPGLRHILMAHCFVTGATTSVSDRACEVGNAPMVPASVFKDFDYVALGHIHKMQKLADNVYYSGTPMPYSFGKEENQSKYVRLIDTDDMTSVEIKLPLQHIRKSLKEPLEVLLKADYPEEIRSGYLDITVTDCYVSAELEEQLRAIYPFILSIKGIDIERQDSSISLSLEEFSKIENDPEEIFKYFYQDIAEPGTGDGEDDARRKHRQELFIKAVTEVTNEAD